MGNGRRPIHPTDDDEEASELQMSEPHYLKDELYSLISNEPAIFEFLQHGSLDGLWYWDLENPEHEWMNAKFWELLGYDPSEMKHLASEWQDLIHPDDLGTSLENFRKHAEDPSHPYDQIVRYRHKDGRTIWVRCRGIAIRDEHGRPTRMLGAHNDLTREKELEQRLTVLAAEDPLTGLANRRSFEDHCEWTVANCRRTNETVSLVMVDLDRFKDVNDTFGHQTGDDVLVATATALEQALRQNDFPARWGGEEFIALLHGADAEAAIEIGERVRAAIAAVDVVEGGITASVGISTFTEVDEDDPRAFLDDRIRAADRALYFAKGSGRDRVVHADHMHVEGSA